MKKISRHITYAESNKRRTLRLTKEAIRTLKAGDLAAVNSGCLTTTWTTQKDDSVGC